jgi:lysyl-tRNA synthetase class 2
MADPKVQEAEAAMANLLLDEVTGEKVSKTELKRRQKKREKDAEKEKKAAAAPPKAAKAEKQTSAEDDEANLSPNVSQSSCRRLLAGIVRIHRTWANVPLSN